MNKKYVIIWAVSSVILILVAIIIINVSHLNTVKKQLLNERTSDENILINDIKIQIKTINWLEELIESSQNKLKETKIVNICTKTQLERLMQWIEYNVNYCTGNNLENFKGLE
jgi:hypothetical protein